MKKQTTKKFIETNYKCYQTSYCALQDLFSGLDPDYYTAGTYGWNADAYIFGDIAIVTGYRPFGEKINHKTAEIFNAAARAAMINNRFDIDEYAGIIHELRRDFIGTITEEAKKKGFVELNGEKMDFDVVVHYMDDEVREIIHDAGITDKQKFVNSYCKCHLKKFGEKFAIN